MVESAARTVKLIALFDSESKGHQGHCLMECRRPEGSVDLGAELSELLEDLGATSVP